MNRKYYIGIDPGISGGAGLLNSKGSYLDSLKFKGLADIDKPSGRTAIYDIINTIRTWCNMPGATSTCIIEKVHSMPKQGVASTFTFGKNYGFLIGCLTAMNVPFNYVTPQKWQKHMDCMTKGDKNVSKSRAQRLYPEVKMTHAIADAILIARYNYEISR